MSTTTTSTTPKEQHVHGQTARRRPVPDELFGGRLKGTFLLDLEVAAVTDHTSTFRTITFRSPDLIDFEWQPGQDLMFSVPGDTSGVRRRYTIRRADAAGGTVDVDIVLHPHGLFATWAKPAMPGDRIDAIGPRGAITVRPGAAHHLFVADASSIGATFAMVEALPPGAPATVLVAVEGVPPVEPPSTEADLELFWLPEADLTDRLRGLELSEGTAAYVNGERSLVHRTAAVLAERQLPADAVTTKQYWRRDRPNAPHGEPPKD